MSVIVAAVVLGAVASAHAFGDDADLLDPRALGGVDDVDDLAVAKRRVADDEHRLFLARLEDVAETSLEIRELAPAACSPTIVRSALYSSTICVLSVGVGALVSSGRLMSMPFCVSGRAAMKMMRSTSSTSMSGVTFMSALACGVSPRDDLLRAEVLVCVRHGYLPPTLRVVGVFGSVMRPMSSMPGFPQVVHGVHDRAVERVLVPLDQTIFSVLSSSTVFRRDAASPPSSTWQRR